MTYLVGIAARAAAMSAFVFLALVLLPMAITLWVPGTRPDPMCGRDCYHTATVTPAAQP